MENGCDPVRSNARCTIMLQPNETPYYRRSNKLPLANVSSALKSTIGPLSLPASFTPLPLLSAPQPSCPPANNPSPVNGLPEFSLLVRLVPGLCCGRLADLDRPAGLTDVSPLLLGVMLCLPRQVVAGGIPNASSGEVAASMRLPGGRSVSWPWPRVFLLNWGGSR